jgi:hypothetical protein
MALSLFSIKYVCLRIKLSLHFALFSFCSIHVCAPFVCMFSLVGHMYHTRDIRPTNENIQYNTVELELQSASHFAITASTKSANNQYNSASLLSE